MPATSVNVGGQGALSPDQTYPGSPRAKLAFPLVKE